MCHSYYLGLEILCPPFSPCGAQAWALFRTRPSDGLCGVNVHVELGADTSARRGLESALTLSGLPPHVSLN